MGTHFGLAERPTPEMFCVTGQCRCPCHATAREVKSALDADLIYLTVQERRLFDTLFAELGDWVERKLVARALYGLSRPADRHGLAVHLMRARRKLADHKAPWRIESQLGALRLMLIPLDESEP